MGKAEKKLRAAEAKRKKCKELALLFKSREMVDDFLVLLFLSSGHAN
jgi:hypothetical protein